MLIIQLMYIYVVLHVCVLTTHYGGSPCGDTNPLLLAIFIRPKSVLYILLLYLFHIFSHVFFRIVGVMLLREPCIP